LIAFSVLLMSWYVGSAVYRYALRRPKSLSSYGSWAVVTGATDGIGKAVSHELARRGMHLLLVSRSTDRLEKVKREVEAAYPVQVNHLTVDYAALTDHDIEAIRRKLASLDVGILYNNVGMSYEHPKEFHELTVREIQSLIHVNLMSTAIMTKLALEHMAPKRRGAIINIGSAAGEHPLPLIAGYCAAKRYIRTLTESLRTECAPHGIFVQCQIPMYVSTKLAKIRRPSWFVPTPCAFARWSVDAIGYETVVSPYWIHALQTLAMSCVPDGIFRHAAYAFHMRIRRLHRLRDDGGSHRTTAASALADHPPPPASPCHAERTVETI